MGWSFAYLSKIWVICNFLLRQIVSLTSSESCCVESAYVLSLHGLTPHVHRRVRVADRRTRVIQPGPLAFFLLQTSSSVILLLSCPICVFVSHPYYQYFPWALSCSHLCRGVADRRISAAFPSSSCVWVADRLTRVSSCTYSLVVGLSLSPRAFEAV